MLSANYPTTTVYEEYDIPPIITPENYTVKSCAYMKIDITPVFACNYVSGVTCCQRLTMSGDTGAASRILEAVSKPGDPTEKFSFIIGA